MTTIAKFSRIAGRVLSVLCLFMGLALAARLLGVGGGSRSPIAMYGVTAFIWLAVFAVGYLFAAVGIWIGSAWGHVLAIGTAACAIFLALFGGPDIRLPALDFLLALLVFVLAAGLFAIVEIKLFGSVHD